MEYSFTPLNLKSSLKLPPFPNNSLVELSQFFNRLQVQNTFINSQLFSNASLFEIFFNQMNNTQNIPQCKEEPNTVTSIQYTPENIIEEPIKASNVDSKEERIIYSVVKKENYKLFLCNHKNCSKKYRSKENLILHFRNKHLAQKPYQCDFCSVCFSHRNGKTYHERKVHTLFFPHLCPLIGCSMKFASKSALNYHLLHQH